MFLPNGLFTYSFVVQGCTYRNAMLCSRYTNPVKVLDDPDFFFFVLHVILNVVVFHVHLDVFFQFLVV